MPRRPPAVPASLVELATRQEGLVSLRQCLEHGLSRQQVAGMVRRKEWEHVARGVYDTGHAPSDGRDPFDQRRRRAAILGLLAYPGSVATGLCALVLRGIQGAPPEIVPEVALPTGAPRASRPPVRLRRAPVDAWDVVDGFRCTAVPEALVQAVPEVPRYTAVALMDSALNTGLITPDELRRAHESARRHPGFARTHTWWDEADGRAESPAETWARLSCVDLGYPPDVLQLPVVGRTGEVIARVDLAWLLPDGGALLVEIDGRDVHSTPSALFRDRARQNVLDSRGTIVRRFTGAEAWRRKVAPVVMRELVAAGWRRRPVRPDVVLRVDA